MPVDIGTDPSVLRDGHGVVDQSLVLRSVTSLNAAICLIARILRCATGNVPLIWPVAVDIGADARLVRMLLSIFTPKAIGFSSINEA